MTSPSKANRRERRARPANQRVAAGQPAGGTRGSVASPRRLDDPRGGTSPPHQSLYAKKEPDLKDWTQAGWGVVLPDHGDLDDRQRAEAKDAPAAVRDLLDHRDGAPVLRYRPELGSAYFMLCERGQEPRKVKTAGGELGADARQLPHYLLIVASPEQIPWRIQYVLNATHFVGRLDLDDVGLHHYVSALIDEWPGSAASRRTAITWSWTGAGRHHLADAAWPRRKARRQVSRRRRCHERHPHGSGRRDARQAARRAGRTSRRDPRPPVTARRRSTRHRSNCRRPWGGRWTRRETCWALR